MLHMKFVQFLTKGSSLFMLLNKEGIRRLSEWTKFNQNERRLDRL